MPYALTSPTNPTAPGGAVLTWTMIGGGGEDWATTLGIGNFSGGTDAEMTVGDAIRGADTVVPATRGGNLYARPGNGPAGYGAFVLGGPTGYYGTARGYNAVDFQRYRSIANRVAAGSYSMTMGGNNRIEASYAFAGGFGCYVTGYGFLPNFVFGSYINAYLSGAGNALFGTYHYLNTGTGMYVNMVAGSGVTITNANSFLYGNFLFGGNYLAITPQLGQGLTSNFVLAGLNAVTVYGGVESSLILLNGGYVGGYNSGSIDVGGSLVVGASHQIGYRSQASYSELVGEAGVFGSTAVLLQGLVEFSRGSGDAPHVLLCHEDIHGIRAAAPNPGAAMRQDGFSVVARTTDNSTTELLASFSPTASPTYRYLVRPDNLHTAFVMVSARQESGAAGTVGDSASWFIQLAVKNQGSTVTLLGSTGTGAPTFNDAGAAAWTVALAVDSVADKLLINVTGETDKNIRWHAQSLGPIVGALTT